MMTLDTSMPPDFDLDHPPPVDFRQPGVVVGTAGPRTRAVLARRLAGQQFDGWVARSAQEILEMFAHHAGAVGVLLPSLVSDRLRGLEADWPHFPCILRGREQRDGRLSNAEASWSAS